MTRDPGVRGRLAALDLLRFAAAAAVMVYHFVYDPSKLPGTELPFAAEVARHGYLGVEVFFIISGFVILWSVRDRTPTAFVRARLLRLYPEYWVSVLVAATVFLAVPGPFGGDPGAGTVLVNLTMVPQWFGAPLVDVVYWTLHVEIKFYVLVWLLLVARQGSNLERWLLAWVAVSAIGTLVPLPHVVNAVAMFPHGAYFAAGGLFYLVFDSGWTAARAAALSVALVTCIALALRAMPEFIEPRHVTLAGRLATGAVLLGAFVYFATLRSNSLGARLGGVTTVAGLLTYPLYLLHNTGKAIFLRGLLHGPEPVLIAAALAWSLGLAYVVMRVGTGPVQAWLRRLLDALITRFLPSRAA